MVDELSRELEALVTLGNESPSLEYKSSMSWRDSLTQAIVVKEALALANTRDGGTIVFGVTDGTFVPEGMAQSDFDSFENDKIADRVNLYAEPRIQTTVRKGRIGDKLFVLIGVEPRRDSPVICEKDGGPPAAQIYAGDIYIRPVGKPEARRVQNAQEMRELVERARDFEVEKLRQGHPSAFLPDVETVVEQAIQTAMERLGQETGMPLQPVSDTAALDAEIGPFND